MSILVGFIWPIIGFFFASISFLTYPMPPEPVAIIIGFFAIPTLFFWVAVYFGWKERKRDPDDRWN